MRIGHIWHRHAEMGAERGPPVAQPVHQQPARWHLCQHRRHIRLIGCDRMLLVAGPPAEVPLDYDLPPTDSGSGVPLITFRILREKLSHQLSGDPARSDHARLGIGRYKLAPVMGR